MMDSVENDWVAPASKRAAPELQEDPLKDALWHVVLVSDTFTVDCLAEARAVCADAEFVSNGG